MRWISRLGEAGDRPVEAVIWAVDTQAAEVGAVLSGVGATRADMADAARPGAPDGGAGRLVRRRLLRALAARWLGANADHVVLRRLPSGSVEVAAPERCFASLAASGAWTVLAVSPSAVGVDVETCPPGRPLPLPLFHPAEADALSRLPEAARDDLFLRLWTAKEAYAKASGETLDWVLMNVRLYAAGGSIRLPQVGRPGRLELCCKPGFVAAAASLG